MEDVSDIPSSKMRVNDSFGCTLNVTYRTQVSDHGCMDASMQDEFLGKSRYLSTRKSSTRYVPRLVSFQNSYEQSNMARTAAYMQRVMSDEHSVNVRKSCTHQGYERTQLR